VCFFASAIKAKIPTEDVLKRNSMGLVCVLCALRRRNGRPSPYSLLLGFDSLAFSYP